MTAIDALPTAEDWSEISNKRAEISEIVSDDPADQVDKILENEEGLSEKGLQKKLIELGQTVALYRGADTLIKKFEALEGKEFYPQILLEIGFFLAKEQEFIEVEQLHFHLNQKSVRLANVLRAELDYRQGYEFLDETEEKILGRILESGGAEKVETLENFIFDKIRAEKPFKALYLCERYLALDVYERDLDHVRKYIALAFIKSGETNQASKLLEKMSVESKEEREEVLQALEKEN